MLRRGDIVDVFMHTNFGPVEAPAIVTRVESEDVIGATVFRDGRAPLAVPSVYRSTPERVAGKFLHLFTERDATMIVPGE
jgi:hypothetical protein